MWTAVAAVHALAALLQPCRRLQHVGLAPWGSSVGLEVLEGVAQAQAGGLIRMPGLLLVGARLALALALPRWLQLLNLHPQSGKAMAKSRHPVTCAPAYNCRCLSIPPSH